MGIKRNKLAMTEKEKHIERSKSSLKNFLEKANIKQDSETARILDSLLTQYQYPYIKQYSKYRYPQGMQISYISYDKDGNKIERPAPESDYLKDRMIPYPEGGRRASYSGRTSDHGFPIDTTHVGIGDIDQLIAELAHAGQWSVSNGKQVPWSGLRDFRADIVRKSHKEDEAHGHEGVYDVKGTMEHDAHHGDYEWSEPVLAEIINKAQKEDKENYEAWVNEHKDALEKMLEFSN